MVISFCLLFPLLQEKYSYNDMTTSIIYIFFFIALLIYSIITIFKVVIFLAFKINSLRSVFLIPYCILILLFVFFCYTINSPYNHPSSVDSYKIRTVISTIGFEEYEINDIHLYEFKKDTDFSSLVHEIPLTEFRVRERFYGYESSDSLSVPEFDAKLCALIFGELTDKYPSYQELIRKIDDQPKTNNNYFNQPSEDVLEENEEHLSNYQITQNELENIDLIGKGIVITGNFSIEREEIKTFLMKIGGQIKSGITGKVDFVFAGEDCGWSKIQKINDLNQSKKANIRILNEADLNYLIKKYGI